MTDTKLRVNSNLGMTEKLNKSYQQWAIKCRKEMNLDSVSEVQNKMLL